MSHILVVDDDPDMRALVGAYLKAADYTVEFAGDGVSGVHALSKQLPDLIITDIQMPRMDGFGLFNAVRADARAARVPVVILTAHNSREMMLKALRLGVDNFITKPFASEELLQIVADELKAPGAPKPAPAAPPAAPPVSAPARPEFFASVMCCEVSSPESFVAALGQAEAAELLAKFAADVNAVVQRDGGFLTRLSDHRLVAVFEEGPDATARPHALRALRSALGVVLAAQRLKPWIASNFFKRDVPEFIVALGVHTGKVQTGPAAAGGAPTLKGEAVDVAVFLAHSIPTLRWSVAASRAAAKAADFAFLSGRGAQLRMEKTGGTVLAVEVKGLENPAEPKPQVDKAATLIAAAVDRNATLVSYGKAAAKPAAKPAGKAAPKPGAKTPAAAPVAPVRKPDQLVDGYVVANKLAETGIVSVYLVNPTAGGPQQVVKTIQLPDDKKRRPHFEQFLQHYAPLSTIDHPNIARTTGQGLTATHLYVVQEYCPGGDLRNLIAEKMSAEDALKVLVRMGGALKAAHQKGFIHGDLKPANVMIRADGSFALTDFAMARIVEYAMGEGGSGVIVRAPDYLSPEMINGSPADAQSDIYTLGLLLHEMLTGARAYASPDLSKVIMDHLSAKVPTLPAGFEKFQPLLDKLMAKTRQDRFASVQEVLTFLAQAKLMA